MLLLSSHLSILVSGSIHHRGKRLHTLLPSQHTNATAQHKLQQTWLSFFFPPNDFQSCSVTTRKQNLFIITHNILTFTLDLFETTTPVSMCSGALQLEIGMNFKGQLIAVADFCPNTTYPQVASRDEIMWSWFRQRTAVITHVSISSCFHINQTKLEGCCLFKSSRLPRYVCVSCCMNYLFTSQGSEECSQLNAE